MTRIFVLCLVSFPLIFIGMMAGTGTLQELIPEIKAQFDERFHSDDPPPVTAPAYDVVDSLIMAEVERREKRVGASMDSLQTFQSRMEGERRELSRLGEEIQTLIRQFETLGASLDAKRDAERRAFAQIFSEMEPERAASIISNLETNSVEYLIRTMKRRQAAEVLALLDPARAASLSERILSSPGGKPARKTP